MRRHPYPCFLFEIVSSEFGLVPRHPPVNRVVGTKRIFAEVTVYVIRL